MDFINKLKNRKTIVILFFAIMCVGLFLRGYQFFMNRSLWHDEAHLALNFISHGYDGLTKPLDNWQAAPILFLFSVETCTRLFGFSEMALRLTPFIISIFTLPFFYLLCYRLTGSRLLSLIAFLLFSVNLSLVYYASELKPYVIDSCMYVLVPWVAVTPFNFISKRRTLWLTVICCLAILLTNTAPIIILLTALYIISNWKWEIKRENLKYLVASIPIRELVMLGIIIVVLLANYLKFIHNHPYSEGMKNEWAFSFWPANIFGAEFKTFLSGRVEDTFYFILHYTPGYGWVFLFFMLIGVVSAVVSRNKTLLLFAVAPVAIQIVLSMLKMYPFYGRFVINVLPACLLLFSAGLYRCAVFVSAKVHMLVAAPIVILSIYFMTEDSVRHFPRWDINIKPSLEYINSKYPDVPVLVTTPHTMYQFYYKTGFVINGNYEPIPWNLTPDSYFEQDAVKSKTGNYIILHSAIGGDNSGPVIEELYRRGMVADTFRNNNFQVTEVKPTAQ